MNLFFDLDGTLWDSKERLYTLFCDITNKNEISIDDYWNQKRAKISNEQILESLGYNGNQIKKFVAEWMKKIEDERYLKLDFLFPYTKEVLQTLKNKGSDIYYVTLRQSAERVLSEIRDKEIVDYCTSCLVSEAKTTKEQLIKDAGIILSSDDIFVGDTGIDVMTAKSIGIKSIAVLSGFRNREILEGYEPDYIINDITELNKII